MEVNLSCQQLPWEMGMEKSTLSAVAVLWPEAHLAVLWSSQVSCGRCGNGLGHEFLNDGPKNGQSRF